MYLFSCFHHFHASLRGRRSKGKGKGKGIKTPFPKTPFPLPFERLPRRLLSCPQTGPVPLRRHIRLNQSNSTSLEAHS